MKRAVVFKCKTPACKAWFPITDMPTGSSRSVPVVLRLEEAPKLLKCPDCGNTHEYVPADKVEVQPED